MPAIKQQEIRLTIPHRPAPVVDLIPSPAAKTEKTREKRRTYEQGQEFFCRKQREWMGSLCSKTNRTEAGRRTHWLLLCAVRISLPTGS